MKYDLVGIGNALLDFQIEVPEKILEELQIKKGSMTLVEPNYQLKVLSLLREKFNASNFKMSSGGSAANSLAGFSNYGGKSLLIGKLGQDENGAFYQKDLNACGVQFSSKTTTELPTGTCLALITPDAERTMLTSLGAAVELNTKDLDVDALKHSDFLYIEGYLWDSPSARAACLEAASIAKQNHTKVAFTYSDAFCVKRHFKDFLDLAKNKIDILFCNEHEAKAATETEDISKAFEEIAKWSPTVCVSIGPKGALVAEQAGKKTDRVATWDAKLVDKLGAGDLFASGVLFGLSQQRTLKEAAYLGCFSATRVIEQMSARLTQDLSKEIDQALQGPGKNAAA